MALKAVLAADVRTLDQVPETPAAAASTVRIPAPAVGWSPERKGGFVVVGHRGKGMNSVASPDRRMRAVRENSLLSFNQAGRFPVDLVDFDVQVGKLLLRRAKDERVLNWNVEIDDSLCTLEEAFLKVDSHLGFNIQLKFDDHAVYREQELNRALGSVLRVVSEHANDRPIIFSTFQPDAAQLLRKLQCVCPVFFLTEAGTGIFDDARRNSLDEAIKLCLESGLQGIVSEVRGVLRDPSAVPRIKESNVALLTNGQLNNIPKHLMGTNGVIVDFVEEITEAVSDFTMPVTKGDESSCNSAGEGGMKEAARPNFSQGELSFLVKLMSQLVQH